MDIQLKKGSLDVCILAALMSEDSYGYKIIQSLQGVIEISESTLYPILKRLEAAECLTSYTVEYNGRLRKFYSITEKGREKIADYIKDFAQLLKIYNFIVKEVRKDAWEIFWGTKKRTWNKKRKR